MIFQTFAETIFNFNVLSVLGNRFRSSNEFSERRSLESASQVFCIRLNRRIWIAQWSERDRIAFGMQKVPQHPCNRSMVPNNELDNADVMLCRVCMQIRARQLPRTIQLYCLIWFIYWITKRRIWIYMLESVFSGGICPKMWLFDVALRARHLQITCLRIEMHRYVYEISL